MTFHPDSLPSLSNQTYIVTGATSGIGYHTAARLAQHNAHVYLCARTADKGQITMTSIQATYPKAKLSVLVMDHTKLSTIVAAAQAFTSQEKQLHGLVNSMQRACELANRKYTDIFVADAGIMATPFVTTQDGYEEQWQVNYLAHWVFTAHLLPMLLATAQQHNLPAGTVRIVNLSSAGHYSAPKSGINFDDTRLETASGMMRYGQSKLANVLHMKTLHGLYGPGASSASGAEIWVAAVHPGLVKSNLGTRAELPAFMKALIAPYRWVGGDIDADQGAWTSLFCAASPAMRREDCGKYWQRLADPNGWQSGLAKDVKLAGKLEEWTREEMRKGGWVE